MSFLPACPRDLSPAEQALAAASAAEAAGRPGPAPQPERAGGQDTPQGRPATTGPFDFVFVSGDAYVDHPSFAAAILGRLLEAEGYQVAILARPDPDDVAAFRIFGRPRLGFLVSAGAVDSLVSSYTANKRPRSEDEYAPGGRPEICLRADGSLGPGLKGRKNARPDRAVIAYAGKCREAFKGVPVIIGGIEASLRRFAHYDYWSDTLRRSILLDSKADLLVYGMGEGALLEAARRLHEAAGSEAQAPARLEPGLLRGIPGTAWWSGKKPDGLGLEGRDPVELPSYENVKADPKAYAESFRLQYRHASGSRAPRLVEESEGRWVVQEPSLPVLGGVELDRLYELPYERAWHPLYEALGGVPALSEVKFSLVSSRGCFGACSFCALALHQGRAVGARSRESILREAETLTRLSDWKGIIHDVGGPTANFRGPACEKMAREGACPDRRCLSPEPCPNLRPDHRDYLELLRALRALPGVRKVFIRSGIRFDYLMVDGDEEFFRELVEHHVSGQLKVAPEHVSERVLAAMGKPPRRVYDAFSRRYRDLNREIGKKQFLVPYFISAHPGAGIEEAVELAEYLRDSGFVPDQVQDFYPTPGSLSTAMYYTGLDPLTGRELHVARGERERAMQRALLQFKKPENRALVREALLLAGRRDLIGSGPKCLVPASG